MGQEGGGWSGRGVRGWAEGAMVGVGPGEVEVQCGRSRLRG